MSKIIILTIWLLNTYDIGSPTWGDLRKRPLQSAMEIIFLGHGPSWSTIDHVQVSMIAKYLIEKKKKNLEVPTIKYHVSKSDHWIKNYS